jgi:hypothetical protein
MRGARAAAAALALAGCQGPPPAPVADAVSMAATGRTQQDVAVSEAARMDCSALRWGMGNGYCRPVEPPPAPPAYCTRSLGRVDCWAHEDPYGYHQRGVADGPWRLTPEQEADRRAPWLRR